MSQSTKEQAVSHRSRVESLDADSHSLENDLEKAQTRAKRYQTLYEIAKLILSEMELGRLLALAMDKVIEVTGAQRGIVALVGEDHKPDFKTARKAGRINLEDPEFKVSRGIIATVIEQAETILSPDAMTDERFVDATTVVELKILSVLCAPIKYNDKLVGIIYVDSSERRGLFNEEIVQMVTEVATLVAIALRNAQAFDDLRARLHPAFITGPSEAMAEVFQLIDKIADAEAKVLIQGENGTGKELVADALVRKSSRRHGPFVKVDCGALPENLIEDELFGHVRGAFTGAISNRKGKFEEADGGTIFLDEIGEMPLSVQAKLLRALESGEITRLGSNEVKYCDVRVISATNRDLEDECSKGTFRQDLYFRLNDITITVPPLRERREDIPVLIGYFINRNKRPNETKRLSEELERCLCNFDYPGNVRQLDNIITEAVLLSRNEVIELDDLTPKVRKLLGYQKLRDTGEAGPKSISGLGGASLNYMEERKIATDNWECERLKELLRLSNGSIREAARRAQMDPANFWRRLKKFGLVDKDSEEP